MVRGWLVILIGGLAAIASWYSTRPADGEIVSTASATSGARAVASCVPRSRRYRTRPSFRPSPFCVSVGRGATAAGAGLLVTPRRMPRAPKGQNAAMILSPTGQLLWYMPRRERVYDLKVVTYRRRPHLAFHVRTGTRDGVYELRDRRYRLVERIAFGAPYRTDLHDLQITDADTAYIGSYRRVRVRDVGVVTEYVVREIAIGTGRVLFEWHSLDHVPLTDSYLPRPRRGIWDYFHGNSIEPPVPGDPTVIVSARNTSAVYGIDRATGEVRWTLGGRRDEFGVARSGATRFCAQHDARRMVDGDLTLFDNGGRGNTERGCPRHAARVMRFRLDHERRRAQLVRTLPSRRFGGADQPLLPVGFGSAQVQPNGNALVGWGTSGRVTEVAPDGRVLLMLHLPNASYRAARTPWVGTPGGRPALVVRRRGDGIEAWASWNGATRIARWRLLAGPNRRRLGAVGRRVPFTALETELRLAGTPRFVAVQALDARGRELARSAARRVP